jgi:hypothetical protein
MSRAGERGLKPETCSLIGTPVRSFANPGTDLIQARCRNQLDPHGPSNRAGAASLTIGNPPCLDLPAGHKQLTPHKRNPRAVVAIGARMPWAVGQVSVLPMTSVPDKVLISVMRAGMLLLPRGYS